MLLHEATFDDELRGDAEAKKHSTTSEAIAVGMAMGAKRIVLTHFSQRYQKIPVMEDMGFMGVNPDNLEIETSAIPIVDTEMTDLSTEAPQYNSVSQNNNTTETNSILSDLVSNEPSGIIEASDISITNIETTDLSTETSQNNSVAQNPNTTETDFTLSNPLSNEPCDITDASDISIMNTETTDVSTEAPQDNMSQNNNTIETNSSSSNLVSNEPFDNTETTDLPTEVSQDRSVLQNNDTTETNPTSSNLVISEPFDITETTDLPTEASQDKSVLQNNNTTYTNSTLGNLVSNEPSTVTEALSVRFVKTLKRAPFRYVKSLRETPQATFPTSVDRQSESSVFAIRSTVNGMRVCVAFDYMRVRVKDIAHMEKYTPALLELFQQDSTEDNAEEKTLSVLQVPDEREKKGKRKDESDDEEPRKENKKKSNEKINRGKSKRLSQRDKSENEKTEEKKTQSKKEKDQGEKSEERRSRKRDQRKSDKGAADTKTILLNAPNIFPAELTLEGYKRVSKITGDRTLSSSQQGIKQKKPIKRKKIVSSLTGTLREPNSKCLPEDESRVLKNLPKLGWDQILEEVTHTVKVDIDISLGRQKRNLE